MEKLLLIFFLVLFSVFLLTNKSRENFNNNEAKYEIPLDKGKLSVNLYNIASKVISDKTSGFKFNGQNAYLEIPKARMDIITLSFLVFPEELTDYSPIVSRGIELFIENGNIGIRHKLQKFIVEKELKQGEYIHVGLKINKNKIILFMDGLEKAFTIDDKIDTSNFCIGTNENKDIYFKGIIGEIKLFTDMVQSTKLCKLHDSCRLGSCKYTEDGKTRNECYQNCLDTDLKDCNEEACTNKCFNPATSRWTPPCKFNPQGSDIFSCINTCVNNQYCDYKRCQSICKSCKDPDTCPWIVSEQAERQDNPYEPVQLVELNGKPRPPKIRVTPMNGKLLVEWEKPESYEGQDGEIQEYLGMYFKTLNKNEGVSLSKVPYPKCAKCKFTINNLDEDTFYSVGIRALNKAGLSDMSNIISIKPQYKSTDTPDNTPTQRPTRQTVHVFCNPTN